MMDCSPTSFRELRQVLDFFDHQFYRGVQGVWCLEGQNPGPTVLISAATHACEVNGLAALLYFMRHEKDIRSQLKGRLLLSLTNLEATHRVFRAKTKKERFKFFWLDENMNRLQKEALTTASPNREQARLQALYPILKTVDFALDLHALPIKGDPMILDIKGPESKLHALAQRLPVEHRILDVTSVQIGYPFAYFCGGFENPDTVAIEMETGIIESSQGYDYAVEFSLAFLRGIGVLAQVLEAPLFEQNQYRVYRGVCFPNLTYELTDVRENFEFVPKGAVLAHGNLGDIVVDRPSYVLFALSRKKYYRKKSIATEVFFLAESGEGGR